MANIKFTITNDSVIVVIDGKTMTVSRGAPNFFKLRAACASDDDEQIMQNVTVLSGVRAWARGHFTVAEDGKTFAYRGEKLPADISARVTAMIAGGESPEPLMKFYELLRQNTSWRSTQQLYSFMKNCGIPIDESGHLLAYKGVTRAYKDCHTQSIDNRPGCSNEMPRCEISDDPDLACHVGFHVGSESYARGFGQRVVICRVSPADVVCVPRDHSYQKMRVCKYSVVGELGERMPETTISREDVPAPAAPTNAALHLDPATLLAKSLDELRRIASHELHIVGASKIRGGKTALVETMMSVMHGIKRSE